MGNTGIHYLRNLEKLVLFMEEILSTLINGLSLGGIYAMIALGYTMVYGIVFPTCKAS